jgi:ubiquinone/menaquinone biosynthesis C-methylase UbiE
MGIGSARGEEFEPIANRIDSLTIVEPSKEFSGEKEVFGVPCEYVYPTVDGSLNFDDGSFDVITCFGVLHHIPNVSHVMAECYRCLKPSGFMLVREPIMSMGDFTKPRPGLTKRERGIPVKIFDKIIYEAGFTTKKKSLVMFSVTQRIAGYFRINIYNSLYLTMLDRLCCKLFWFNVKYYRPKRYQKIGSNSVFYVLTK